MNSRTATTRWFVCILGLFSYFTTASVVITNGTVQGVIDEINGVEKFLGIPFAEPPVKDRRLRQAVPLQKSFNTLVANKFGPSCISKQDQGNSSEDCLTINIWRPVGANVGNESLPVMLWLYGGGLTAGYSGDPTFEGTAMTRISNKVGKPIIVASINYRLGPFGFLNGKEMAELGLLNIGMLDQRLALHWIQENIGAFGGDRSKVTIAGFSAGAVSAYSHMMAFGGRDDGLFRGVILQSGGAFPLTSPDTPSFQATFDSLIMSTSCSPYANASAAKKLDCIRSLPVDVFRAKVGSNTGQSIDGSFSRTSIQRALPAGSFVKVATIVGTNTNEGLTSAPTGVNTTEQLFDPVARGFFRPRRLPNNTVSNIIKMYPEEPRLGCPYHTGDAKFSPGTLDKKACSIFGDIVQIAPARMIARSLARANVPIYNYQFNHLPYSTKGSPKGIRTGEELPYVFSNLKTDQPWDKNLAYEMTASWGSFVHDLNPSSWTDGMSPPIWPVYGPEANIMVFNGYGSTVQQDKHRLDGIQYVIDNVLPDGAA